MIGVVATLKVKDGSEAAFETVFRELVKGVHENEPGCKLYELFRVSGQKGVYVVQEQYDDVEAQKAHRASAHFKAAGPKLAPLLAAAPEIVQLEKV